MPLKALNKQTRDKRLARILSKTEATSSIGMYKYVMQFSVQINLHYEIFRSAR